MSSTPLTDNALSRPAGLVVSLRLLAAIVIFAAIARVLDIVGRAPVKKASPRRILQGVIPTGIRKTPCCHGARGMRKSDYRCSVR